MQWIKAIFCAVLRFVGLCLLWGTLLRVPLIISLLVAALPVCIIFDFGPSALVRGAYETGPAGFGVITLVLGFLVSSFFETAWLVYHYGPHRFHLSRKLTPAPRWLQWVMRGLFLFGPIATVVACCLLRATMPAMIQWLPQDTPQPPGSWLAYVLWGCAGCLPALAAHFAARDWFREKVRVDVGKIWHRFFAWLGPGYAVTENDEKYIARGHLRAGIFCLFSWTAFAVVKWTCRPAAMPAGLYVLLSLLSLSWLLSAAAFFLDRYRASFLILVSVWLMVSNVWRGDYIYLTPQVENRMQTEYDLPSAASVLGIPNPQAQPDNNLSKYLGLNPGLVCVSAVGGGIHSGAWEVEVLTRLAEIPGCEKFSEHICVLSGTSGGAYGSMLYTHGTYPVPGTRPPAAGSMIRAVVQTSSLSSGVAALTYHDLLGYLFPVPWGNDRGRALEAAWAENSQASGDRELEHVTLWDWSERVRQKNMPVVLFTSGTRESGRPVIYGTSKVADWNFNARQANVHRRPDGPEEPFPLLTTAVTTGARLSATFPWVSPSARPDPRLKTRRAEHQLDGGYYDNYGIVALNAWLDEGLMEIFGTQSLHFWQRVKLQAGNEQRPPAATRGRILVIQIRYAQTNQEPLTCAPGFFFQLTAPIFGLYQSRVAGQQLRSDEYFDVFARYWKARGIEVENAAFSFVGDPPLSWHLTQKERADITSQGQQIAFELDHFQEAMKATEAIPDPLRRAQAVAEVQRKYARGIAADRVRQFLQRKD